MRILALSTAIPFPPHGGGKLRTYHLLRALARSHELTLAGFTYGQEPGEAPYAVRIVAVPWTQPPVYQEMTQGDAVRSQRAADQLSQPTGEPWCVSWAESVALDAVLRRLAREHFDLVLLEGSPTAHFLHTLRPDTPKILDFMDVYTRMALRQVESKQGAEAEIAAREAERTRRFERRVAAQCNLCLAVSDEEAAAARDLLNAEHVHVVPNGVDTAFFTPAADEPEENSLLFTGTMSYRPNSEAVQYFVQSVLPLILSELPHAVLHVVGDAPPKEVTALAGRNVTVHGYVPDMRPYHRRAAVVIAPLRRGGGTKLKVLEAAAMRKAIVTTSVGVEGLPFRAAEDLIVADSAAQFARAVILLAKDRPRQRSLGERARQVALQHDWDKIGDRLCQIVETLLPRRCSRRSSSHV